MPLTTIYIIRHAIRASWQLDPSTGVYTSSFPFPTGSPIDPPLTSAGIRQSHELGTYLASDEFAARSKVWRVYSSPFYRCLQTISPGVEGLKARQDSKEGGVDLSIRVENGLAEWFGVTKTFTHPPPPTLPILQEHYPNLLNLDYKASFFAPPGGENIGQLHNRQALTLSHIIATVDAELKDYEASLPINDPHKTSEKAIIICAHAAPIVAMGRVLTGNMPEDVCTDDFRTDTAGINAFKRRSQNSSAIPTTANNDWWTSGVGVGGGWDCVVNGQVDFLADGAQRHWHFHGEEDFDTMPAGVIEKAGYGDPMKKPDANPTETAAISVKVAKQEKL